MSSSTVSVIVDMQPFYGASRNEETIQGVSKEIQKAIENQREIIFVKTDLPFLKIPKSVKAYNSAHKNSPVRGEIDACIQPKLLSLVANYSKVHEVEKDYDSGGKDVLDYCEKNAISIGKVRICGVNTAACVLETAMALQNAGLKITVVANACNHERLNSSEDQNKLEQSEVLNSMRNWRGFKVK